MCPRDHLPEMATDGVDEECLAKLIPIVSPRIHGSMTNHLHNLTLRMVSPDPATNRNSLSRTAIGQTQFARRGTTATPVKPPVRPPAQAVGEIVIVIVRHLEPVQDHLHRSVRNAIPVGIRDK